MRKPQSIITVGGDTNCHVLLFDVRDALFYLGFVQIALVVFGILGGGYWMLYRLEHAAERAQVRARARLTTFYKEVRAMKAQEK